MICTPECWIPVRCSVCRREFSPVGRSVALKAAGGYCDPWEPCDPDQLGQRQRHLWSEHDPFRTYINPEGWAAHVAACELCKETNDE